MLPFMILSYPLPFKKRYYFISLWPRFLIWSLGVICQLKYQVHGQIPLDKQPVIIFSKHQSAWETFALQKIFPFLQTWVAKRELAWIPLFGWALLLIDPILLNRKQGKKALKYLLDKGQSCLQQQRNIMIFPEGTRVAPNENVDYKIGGAMLAAKTATPIICVAHNSGDYWGRKSWLKKAGIIHVVISPPIITQGKKALHINQESKQWIDTTMQEIAQGKYD